MTSQEFYLQKFILETFKIMDTRFINPETQKEETNQTLKEYFKNKEFKEKLLDDVTDTVYKTFGIKP